MKVEYTVSVTATLFQAAVMAMRFVYSREWKGENEMQRLREREERYIGTNRQWNTELFSTVQEAAAIWV